MQTGQDVLEYLWVFDLDFVELVVQIQYGRQLDVLEFDFVVFVADAERIQLVFVHCELVVGHLNNDLQKKKREKVILL